MTTRARRGSLSWPRPIVDARARPLAEVQALRDLDREIYPARGDELKALELVPFEKVRVVILGLDPYPTPRQATGLAFSVPRSEASLPIGLRSIHTAMAQDGYPPPKHGDLSGWTTEGVLLLNRALTFERDRKSGAHLGIWQGFTDEVIRLLNQRDGRVVFVLWGNAAQTVEPLITQKQHRVVTAPHPSSRGEYRKRFQAAGTFQKVNRLLDKGIDWSGSLR
jgi:uracil-DNA glycosylase